MRSIVVLPFLLVTCIGFGQTTWFKHLPGWRAKSSLVKGDTLLTCGMNSELKSFGKKFETFLYWNKINGDSIDHYKINLDSLEKDPTRSTAISYDYYSSGINNDMPFHFINLSYGEKKERAFLMKMDKFYTHGFKLDEYTIDTFDTYINNVVTNSSCNIVFIPYVIVNKPLERDLNTIIFKERNGKRVKIKEIYNTSSLKYETTCHIANIKSNKSFFFIRRTMTDYAGAPRLWYDVIIKMDTLGNELWSAFVNNRDSINPAGVQMVQKPNGNILVSWCDYYYRRGKNPQGNPNYPQKNNHCSVWFLEIDSTGQVLWRKNIKTFLTSKVGRDSSHNLFHSKATALSDGVLWAGNYSHYYDHNYLLKTDFNGNPIWYREYELYPNNSAEQEFKPYDVTATPDGGYVLTGEYISDIGNTFKQGCQLATIIKVDSFGCLEPGCQKNDSTISVKNVQKTGFKLYPNPNNGNFTVEIDNPSKDVSIQVFDMIGNLVTTLEASASQTFYTIDLKVSSGIYLLKVSNGRNVFNKKVCINH